MFQFTRPRGARLQQVDHDIGAGKFQFTRPRGARRAACNTGGCPACFNSRAHAGRDPLDERDNIKCWVSIHAPTRGATEIDAGVSKIEEVSIHAPTRGATGIAPALAC